MHFDHTSKYMDQHIYNLRRQDFVHNLMKQHIRVDNLVDCHSNLVNMSKQRARLRFDIGYSSHTAMDCMNRLEILVLIEFRFKKFNFLINQN